MPQPYISSETYDLGIALSGGGARGIAHAGALKAIEECGLKPGIVAGVSAGSIVAVLYAGGVPPELIKKMFASLSFRDFTRLSLGSGGLFSIDRFRDFVTMFIPKYRNLEDLPIETVVGATNFDTCRPDYFTAGPLGPIVAASCSVPVAFPPVEIEGTAYVDGGVLRNLPAWTIRSRCKQLIGIDVSPIDESPRSANSLLSNAIRAYSLLAASNQTYDQSICDIIVHTTDIASHPIFDLDNIDEVYDCGYRATHEALRKAGLSQD